MTASDAVFGLADTVAEPGQALRGALADAEAIAEGIAAFGEHRQPVFRGR